MKRPNKKSTIVIITVVSAVILFCGWCALAVIHLESIDGAGRYDGTAGTRFIAHRGYSAAYFENTQEAFEAAAEESFFQGIETDLRVTKDGVFVCSHDDAPFADKSVKISEKNYDEIKDLPLDLTRAHDGVSLLKEYRICTLEGYLNAVMSSQKTAVIELKSKLSEDEIHDFLTLVFSKISSNRLIVCSFDKRTLDRVYSIRNLNVMLFTSNRSLANLYTFLGYNVGLRQDKINEKFLSKSHRRGAYVDVYTVNDPRLSERLVASGADYITTDGILL